MTQSKAETKPSAARRAVEQFVNSTALWLLQGDIEALTRHTSVPMITYLGDDIVVTDQVAHLKSIYAALCARCTFRGVERIEPRILDYVEYQSGRQRALISYQMFHALSERDMELKFRLMMSVEPDSGFVRIEIFDHVSSADTPMIDQIKALHAQQIGKAV